MHNGIFNLPLRLCTATDNVLVTEASTCQFPVGKYPTAILLSDACGMEIRRYYLDHHDDEATVYKTVGSRKNEELHILND